MNMLDGPPNASGTLDSLLYDPDETGRRSPMLEARPLQLNISPSPPPDATEVSVSSEKSPGKTSNRRRKVKPTRGDAVLIQFMGDGKDPDIYNTAGTFVLGDSDSDVDDSDIEREQDIEAQDKERPFSKRPPDNSGASSTPSPAHSEDDREPLDTRPDEPMGLQAASPDASPLAPSLVELHSRPSLPALESALGMPPNIAVVASAALSTVRQTATNRSDWPTDLDSRASRTGRDSRDNREARENSPHKLKCMALGALSLEDRKRPYPSDDRLPDDRFDGTNGNSGSNWPSMAATSQLLTPSSINTPRESSLMAITTPPATSPPYDHPGLSYATTGFPSLSKQQLPSIQKIGLRGQFDPSGNDSLPEAIPQLPPIRNITLPHSQNLPNLSSITQNRSPPISPHDRFRQDSEISSSGCPSPYYSPAYNAGRLSREYVSSSSNNNRPEQAALSAPSRTRPVLAPATTAPSATAQPVAPRYGSDGGNERKMSAERVTGHTGNFRCTVPGCNAPPFQTQYLLNSHANVHSSERPHYCPVRGCPRSRQGFKRKNEMIRHGLVHASPGYVCPFCSDREHKYPRPDNLQRHVRAHHKEKAKDDPLLRNVLSQRPSGLNQKRRRRIT